MRNNAIRRPASVSAIRGREEVFLLEEMSKLKAIFTLERYA